MIPPSLERKLVCFTIRDGGCVCAGIHLFAVLRKTPPLLLGFIRRFAVRRLNIQSVLSFRAHDKVFLFQGAAQEFRVGMQGELPYAPVAVYDGERDRFCAFRGLRDRLGIDDGKYGNQRYEQQG